MYTGKIVFAQVIDHLPLHTFRCCVERYRGHYNAIVAITMCKAFPVSINTCAWRSHS